MNSTRSIFSEIKKIFYLYVTMISLRKKSMLQLIIYGFTHWHCNLKNDLKILQVIKE